MKQKLLLFMLTLALWFVLAGRVNIQVLLLGTIICSIITLMSADSVSRLVHITYEPKVFLLKIYDIGLVIGSYIYDVFLSAARVSRHAFEMKPTLSPRIVKIKSSLEHKNNNETLANFITLTQGTVALDFDVLDKNYFIHWIDVQSDDEAEGKKARIRKHEKLIAKIFD